MTLRVLLAGLLLAFAPLLPPPCSSQPTAPGVDDFLAEAAEEIRTWAADRALVEAVRLQNGRRMPPNVIRSIDLSWVEDPERNRRMRALMSNPCAERLKAREREHPMVRESFAMDQRGALVCMTRKTSDYWQGDEDKFVRAFAEGRGDVFIDRPRHDRSTDALLVQISVPVVDGGRAIGVLTVGLDYAAIQQQTQP